MNIAIKHDENKPKLDLLPVGPLIDIARVLMKGKETYGRDNWRKGLAWSRCYAATLRHLFAWQNGETNDPETGLNHLAHAACEIFFLLEFSRTHPELDDRPHTKTEVSEMKTPPNLPVSVESKKTWIDCVREFNKAYSIPDFSTVNYWNECVDAIKEQMSLIDEEHNELKKAYTDWYEGPSTDMEEAILDAICDSIYVLIGLALKMGFNLDEAFAEVHRSNMTKLGSDGKPVLRKDGKILKGPDFTPPNLRPFLS